MRNKGNESVYSEFERELLKRDIKAAIDALKTGKGSGVLLRNLNYIISRCESKEDINYVESFSFYDDNNELIFLVINSTGLERKIMTVDYEWKSYALNKFKEYKSDEYVEKNRKKLSQILYKFEKRQH